MKTPDAILGEVVEWLRIPSVSTDGGDPEALLAAARWIAARVTSAGGEVELWQEGGNPLVVGTLEADRPDAPTVLVYGHYDVQGVGDPDAWRSPPFEPEIRGDRLYARGASDDKGNFYPLLAAACALKEAGDLPVHVRVLVDGEEEVAGDSAGRWLRADPRGADCAIVFDSWMVDEVTLAITVGLRGIAQLRVTVRTGSRDLHSGVYGGSVLNAAHVLHTMLAAVLPAADGTLRPELRAGIAAVDARESAGWAALPPGEAVLDDAGAQVISAGAGADYYRRTWTDSSLDVTGISVGGPRTIIPAVATAVLSQRLVPTQRADDAAAVLERLLRDAAPEGVDVDIDAVLADPVHFDADSPPLRIAAESLERATGRAPALVRWGGAIPIVADLAAVGIPTIVTGFALPTDHPHAANESFRLESLRLGTVASFALLEDLAELPARAGRPELAPTVSDTESR